MQYLGSQEETPAARVSNAAMRREEEGNEGILEGALRGMVMNHAV